MRIIGDVIKIRILGFSWIRVGPQSVGGCPTRDSKCKQKEKFTPGWKIKDVDGIIHLQVKECQGLPVAIRSQERDNEKSSSEPQEGTNPIKTSSLDF